MIVEDMDSVRADLKRKKEAACHRNSSLYASGGGNDDAFGTGIPLSDDEKKSLALNISAAIVPGAYNSNSATDTRKASQDQLMAIAQMRNAQKDRFHRNPSTRGLEEYQPDLVDDIDDLQARMNELEAEVVVQTAKEAADGELHRKKKGRKLMIIAGCLLVVIIICAAVGIVVGSQVGDGDSDATTDGDAAEESSSPPPTFDPFLDICNPTKPIASDDTMALRYMKIRSAIGARFPEKYASFYATVGSGLLPVNVCTPENIALMWVSMEIVETDGASTVNVTQLLHRYVLAFLYASWGGPEWRERALWLSDVSECRWYGVRCDEKSNVISLSLQQNSVSGVIETRLGWLSELKVLELSGNTLEGSIPSEVWFLPQIGE